jgi:soluble lytic murein transglycosylase-like protein
MMQIRLGTARAMGYTGSAAGLLDPDTNMTYAVRYLAGAYKAAGGNHDRAVSNYARGYYYQAKRQGFSPYTTASAQGTPFQVASLMPRHSDARAAYASTGRGIPATTGDIRDAAINVMTAKESSP